MTRGYKVPAREDLNKRFTVEKSSPRYSIIPPESRLPLYMRCLYCGKELALLKRWTRGGQFCSEAHKQSYQEEYNRIALSRLLQAQYKTVTGKASKKQEDAPNSNGPGPLHEVPVAVEEAAVALHEAPVAVEVEEAPVAVQDAPAAVEVPPLEEGSTAEEPPPETLNGPDEENPEEAVWEPAQMAGIAKGEVARPPFLDTVADSLVMPAYAEPWERVSTSPAPPEWRSSGEVQQALPQAAVVELKFRPGLSDSEHPASEVNVTPREFVHSKALPRAAEAILANRLASAGLVKQTINPWASECSAAASVDSALNVPLKTEYRESSLLELSPSQVAFAEEDADVVLAPADGVAGPVEDPAEAAPASVEDAAPEQADDPEALAQAGETLAPADEAILWPAPNQNQPEYNEADEAETPNAGISSLAMLHEGLNHIDEQIAAPEAAEPEPIEPLAVLPEAGEAGVEAQHHEKQALRASLPLVEIPVKKLAPSKPAPKEGADALIEMPVFLPRLTGLPLRPKMGVFPAASAPGSKKGARSAAQSVQSSPEVKPVSDSKSAAEPKPDSGAAGKPARTSSRPSTEAAPKTAARPAENAAPAGKVEPATPEKGQQENGRAGKPSGLAEAGEKLTAAPEVKEVAAASPESAARQIEAPSFGVPKIENKSLLNSFPVKLGIAAALVALCITIYFVFGGKPQAPAQNPAADKAGPSIMVGGGGWVEGWAGDPVDAHYGRQITIYRPSLKLSDYRIDFKGEIETKSLGWVFRAADPENYYAMKLAIVTPGLQPKVALLKYVVVNGHETQAGRVPIDLDVKLDTLYSVRVDVRGTKFTTYVQGQLMDTWTDDQLKSGGMGFLNERVERGRIKSVSVSLLNGGK